MLIWAMHKDHSRSLPVSHSYDLGSRALAVGLLEKLDGSIHRRLAGQDSSIIRRDVIKEIGTVALCIANALASDLASTNGCLQTVADSRSDSAALYMVSEGTSKSSYEERRHIQCCRPRLNHGR